LIAAITLCLVLADLLLLSEILDKLPSVRNWKWIDTPIFRHPAIWSINFVGACLLIDLVATVATFIALDGLRYESSTAVFSLSALLVRWGGWFVLIVFYTVQFPLDPIGKLLNPIVEKIADFLRLDVQSGRSFLLKLVGWFIGVGRIPPADSIGGLLRPWIGDMRETAEWIGYPILGGAVVPYLGVITASYLLENLRQSYGFQGDVAGVLDLLMSLSDCGGVLVILSLMVNLVYLVSQSKKSGGSNTGLRKERIWIDKDE
jgi:hypothetical protein